jgi:hypothetical protein
MAVEYSAWHTTILPFASISYDPEEYIVAYKQIGKGGRLHVADMCHQSKGFFLACPGSERTPVLLCSANREGIQSGTRRDDVDRG